MYRNSYFRTLGKGLCSSVIHLWGPPPGSVLGGCVSNQSHPPSSLARLLNRTEVLAYQSLGWGGGCLWHHHKVLTWSSSGNYVIMWCGLVLWGRSASAHSNSNNGQNLFHTVLCTCPGLSSLTLKKHLQSKDNYVALTSKPPAGCVVSSICGEIVRIETVLEHSQGWLVEFAFCWITTCPR